MRFSALSRSRPRPGTSTSMSNVRVASKATVTSYPRLPAIRAVVSTHMFVWIPQSTSDSMCERPSHA
ncbi:hypothetical protein HMPREF0972_02610 [Actinomyces sp. oral taxon 848 str. F0332]|nr:hypothetical protein HMPREF0972_02610 [Actinomyces sp. oral taxon 848 str. F0332]